MPDRSSADERSSGAVAPFVGRRPGRSRLTGAAGLDIGAGSVIGDGALSWKSGPVSFSNFDPVQFSIFRAVAGRSGGGKGWTPGRDRLDRRGPILKARVAVVTRVHIVRRGLGKAGSVRSARSARSARSWRGPGRRSRVGEVDERRPGDWSEASGWRSGGRRRGQRGKTHFLTGSHPPEVGASYKTGHVHYGSCSPFSAGFSISPSIFYPLFFPIRQLSGGMIQSKSVS